MLSAVFENPVSTWAGKNTRLQSGTVMVTSRLCIVERGSMEERRHQGLYTGSCSECVVRKSKAGDCHQDQWDWDNGESESISER